MLNPLAGKKAPSQNLVDIAKLLSSYYLFKPDISNPLERVSFGTSGHRGSSFKRSFNEAHIYAITQAVCDYRKMAKIEGPLFIGRDTHALSTPAQMSAIEVLVANGVSTYIAKDSEFIPTPVISFTILEHNKKETQKGDGIVISPSHNPPEDGGFKYNPPNGGPADTNITSWIEDRANELLKESLKGVKRTPYEKAIKSSYIKEFDFITPYVKSLKQIVDIKAIEASDLKLAVHPLGGTAIAVYKRLIEEYKINLDIIHPFVDYTFSFMSLDFDGKIRMDCSSAFAMNSLLELKDNYDLAFGNDVDADRHGIVTPKGGLMNPNHYLSVAIGYLFASRKWDNALKVGKTAVSSSMIDRVVSSLDRELYETPVGFKWFVDGLYSGYLGFGGEESAGASFLRFDGSAFSTDKDGIIMNLLGAEILAKTSKDPFEIYKEYEERFGKFYYGRVDAPATKEIKESLKNIDANSIGLSKLAGAKIEAIYSKAIGNSAPLGGIKILSQNGWVAMRPSGTEDIYKIYAESFISNEHLKELQKEAQAVVDKIIKSK